MKTKLFIYPVVNFLIFSIVLVFLFSSCGGNKNTDFSSLIPADVQNKEEYIKNSINYFNDINDALLMPLSAIKGRSISPAFAKRLHDTYKNDRSGKSDSINSITFSYSKILQSINAANIIQFDSTEVTVIFGRYPKEITADELIAINIEPNVYNGSYVGKLTCILTYRTPGVPAKKFFQATPPYQYDNVGQPCPPNCDPIDDLF